MKQILSWFKSVFNKKGIERENLQRYYQSKIDSLVEAHKNELKKQRIQYERELERQMFLYKIEVEAQQETGSMSMLEAYKEYKNKCNDKSDS